MNIVPIEANGNDLLHNMQYAGDNMEPTISKWDFVTIEPMDSCRGEGIYAVQIDGYLSIKRVQSFGGNGLVLSSDNKLYPADDITLERLNECIVGRVIGAWKPFVSHCYLDRMVSCG